jgi:hypothetical protein
MGTPPQTFEFAVENGVPSSPPTLPDHLITHQCRCPSPPPTPTQVLAVTMVDDVQPIICDAFSSTGDAQISGNPSSGVNTDEGNNAGAAAGAIIAVIVAGRVGMVVLAGATVTPPPHLHPPPPLGRPAASDAHGSAVSDCQQPLSCTFPPLPTRRLSSPSALASTGNSRGPARGPTRVPPCRRRRKSRRGGSSAGLQRQDAPASAGAPCRAPGARRFGVPEAHGAPLRTLRRRAAQTA